MSDDLPQFSVEVVHGEDEHVIAVHGEIDLVSGPDLKACIELVIDATEGDILVDLADVDYIDSTGLHILLEAHERMARTGWHLSVQNPSPQVLRLLDICGVCNLVATDEPMLTRVTDDAATNGLETSATRNGVSAVIGSPAALATPTTFDVVIPSRVNSTATPPSASPANSTTS